MPSAKHPALITALKHVETLNPDQFELYFEHKTSTKIDAKNGEIDALSRAEDAGMSIRVIKDKRMGFSFTTSLEKDAIHKAVESAIEVARFMPEDPFAGLYSFGSVLYPELDVYDPKGLAQPLAAKVEMAKALEASCRKVDPRITAIRAASINERSSQIHLLDSSGEHIHHKSTMFTASVTCKAEQDGDSQMGGEFGFSNFLDTLNPTEVAHEAAKLALEKLGAIPAPTLQCPAVLRNSVVAELIEFLSGSFSAEQIDKGRSMLAGKEKQLVFSENVTLIDDGLMPGGMGSSPFDGEGVPSRKLTLIDGGFFVEALYDTYYGRKFDKEPTGSAGRGIKAPPSISFSNLYMQAGRKTANQLFDGLSRGILITDLMGIHTANPVTGDFSLGAAGILIENGKLTRPVRGFAIAGNVLELFRRMTDIGSDLRFFGNVGAPSVRVSEISVGGA